MIFFKTLHLFQNDVTSFFKRQLSFFKRQACLQQSVKKNQAKNFFIIYLVLYINQ